MIDEHKINSIKQWLGAGAINIFGRPFAGKDSQSKILANLFEGQILGGGDILRGSEMPDHIKAYMKTGELIPSEDYVNIVLPFLSKTEFANKPLFLSSVGRWHGEEDGVMKALQASQHTLRAVIYLAIPENEVFKRWDIASTLHDRGSRHDDTKEILSIRLKEFQDKTMPVIEFYRQKGLLVEIDGSKSREAVSQDIIDALYGLAC